MSTFILIRDDVVYREIDGEIVALSLASGEYVGFDAIGTSIWRLIEGLGSVALVRAGLLAEFDVDEPTCEAELNSFIETLLARQLVTLDATATAAS